MLDFLFYDLKVAVLIAVFYMFYRLLLARETFHRVNRVVLLLMAVASFVLPLCVVTVHRTVTVAVPEVAIGELHAEVAAQAAPERPLWQVVLPLLYIIGVVAVLGHSLLSLLRVWLLIRRSERHRGPDGITVCVTGNVAVAPFSWMRYIVMNRGDYEAGNAAILAHERGHIRLRHSWDVLLVDLLTAPQWFNPAIWMLRQDLRAIHEYEADAEVLSQGINARQYQYLLISKAAGIGGYSIANGIGHSTLKNRIKMMTNRKSQSSHLLKLLALVPIVGAALALNARTVTDYVYGEPPQKQQVVKKGTKNASINAGTINEIVVVEQAPEAGTATEDSEPFTVRGKVLDEAGKPVIGAVVQIEGSKKGSVSDMNGAFAIETKAGDCLNVSYVGLETARLAVSKALAKEKECVVTLAKEVAGGSKVYDVVDQMPQFPGGQAALMEYLVKNVRYPEEAHKNGIQGRVIANFVVGKDGSISNVGVVRPVDALLDAEAVRVLSDMPNWIPGKQGGQPVAVKYVVPVTFRLDGDKATVKPDATKVLSRKNVDVEVDGQLVDPAQLEQLLGSDIERITIEKAKENGEATKIVIATKKKE